MYFLALATDYDGTLAHDGVVDAGTVDALRRLKESGRRLVLVTGRELPDLQQVFPELPLCDLAVVENGALLYEPATGRETPGRRPAAGCVRGAPARARRRAHCPSAAASSRPGSRWRRWSSR